MKAANTFFDTGGKGVAREKYEVEILAPPQKVFAHMDDISNVGWHMSAEFHAYDGQPPHVGSD